MSSCGGASWESGSVKKFKSPRLWKNVFSELLKVITKTRSARGKTQCRFDLAEYTFAPESWFCIRTDHVLLVLFRFVARFIFANKEKLLKLDSLLHQDECSRYWVTEDSVPTPSSPSWARIRGWPWRSRASFCFECFEACPSVSRQTQSRNGVT